jgi:hypothetical protein
MTGETLQEIRRRMGLPEFPQEIVDKARREFEEQERVLADPERKAARQAESEAFLAQFRRPKVTMLPGETLPELHRRLGLPEIPQEAIDKAREQIREHEQRMADPRRRAARIAQSEALLAQFGRPKATILPGETLPEVHRRLGLPEIPQEAIDRARQQIEERAKLLADPSVQAEISANRQAVMEWLGEPARNA